MLPKYNRMNEKMTRRRFVGTTILAGAGMGLNFNPRANSAEAAAQKPAILGGPKRHQGSFPNWPVFDDHETQALNEVLRSGHWGRLNGSKVAEFEQAYQKLTGAKHCIATTSGTTSLLTSLGALGIGPGDEVILPPYTFIATYNAIVFHYALPVFADVDAASFQIDAGDVQRAITPATKAILPVHVGGATGDMEAILRAANGNQIPVIEDACQAHLAEWRGKFVGQSGLAGCFSFQASKNLTAGEGGMIVTNDDDFAARCYNFHNHGHGRSVDGKGFSGERGANFRMTEFQGGLLLAQLARLDAQARIRDENARLLDELLSQIPGIRPAVSPGGCTRSSHHLYMFRYDKDAFAGLSRAQFAAAMSKEGFTCSTGYSSLRADPYVQGLAKNPHYLRIYGKAAMANWLERNRCPITDKLSTEALWFTQTTLLGTKSEMEQIAESIRNIQRNASDIAKK
jgi:perosamine synthetase